MQKNADRQRKAARRVFWEYNRAWLQSRLFIGLLLMAVGIYCGIRYYGAGSFWPGMVALCLSLLFFFLPFSVTRFVVRGWGDVRKNRISRTDIIVRSCDDSPHIMLNRGVESETVRKWRIVDADGGFFYGYTDRYAPFDGSALAGSRFRVDYLTKSRLIVGLAPLDPLPKRVKDQARRALYAPLIQQYR